MRNTETYNTLQKPEILFPHDEAFGLTDSPQTRMKSRFSSSRVYCIYNDFTTNENPWMKRHGTAGTLAVPFCYHDME